MLLVVLVIVLIVLVLFDARRGWRSSETLGDRSIAVVFSDLVRERRAARCYSAKIRRRDPGHRQ
jgi:hypothetical protein